MNERRVTLADVAARAKVHVTTVSLALRERSGGRLLTTSIFARWAEAER